MNTPFELEFGQETGLAERIVYVRQVDVSELPKEVRDESEGLDQIYALHSADGARLALVRDRQMAFALARQNDFAPVTVH